MTTIDRLGIQGIRSYGPEQEQAITFTPPLTLILGPNGSGKTTVIESLRMATCGVLPPNSASGQAFVHDPRVSHVASTETKGKIRLRFLRGNGTKVTVSRLFQLSNKKGANRVEKQQYKQFDGSIEMKTKGEKDTHINNKCAEIDKLVPELMCVSTAVLQNVIFCHQEESNWILGEPKVLKEKFDAIFASTRYSKALEQVKKTQTELKSTIKDKERDEAEEKQLKKHAHETTQKLRKCEADKTAADQKTERLDVEIKSSDSKISKCNEGLQTLQQGKDHAKHCDERIAWNHKEMQKVSNRITSQMDDSKEELLKAKDEIEKQLESAEDSRKKDKDEVEKTREAKEKCGETLHESESQLSRATAELDVMKGQESERLKLAKIIADQFDMDKSLLAVPFETAPTTFARELKQKLETKKRDSDMHKKENKRAKDKLQEALSKANTEQDRAKQAITYKKDQIREKENESNRVQQATDALNFDDGALTRFEEAYEGLKKELTNGLTKDPQKTQSEIESKEAPLQRKIKDRNAAKDALRSRQADQEKIAVVKSKKEDLGTRKKRVEESLADEPVFEEVLGYKPTLHHVGSMPDVVKGEKQSRRSQLEKAQQEHMQAKNACGQLTTTLKEKEEERKQYNTHMSDLIEQANRMKAYGQDVKGLQEAVAGTQSFEQIIAALQKKIAKYQKSSTFASSMKDVVGTFKNSALSDKCCPLCTSQINPGTAEERTFLEQLEKLMSDAQSIADPSVTQQKIDEYTAQIDALKKAQGKKIEAGVVEGKCQSLAQVEDELKEKIERKEKEVSDCAANERRMQEHLDKAEHVDELLRGLDIVGFDALEKSIASDEKELSSRDANKRGILELEEEHSELESEVERLQKDLDALKSEHHKNMEEFNKRKRRADDAKEKVKDQERKKVSYDEKINRRNELVRQIDRLKKENIDKLEEMPGLEKSIDECLAKKRDQEYEFDSQEKKADHEINDMAVNMHKNADYEKKIVDYKSKKLDKSSQVLKDLIEKKKTELEKLDQKHTDAKTIYSKNGDQASKFQEILREIEDNLTLIEYKDEISKLKDEKSAKQDKMQELPPAEDLQKLRKTTEKERTDKNNEVQRLEGLKSSLDQQIKDHKGKLKEKDYVDIDAKYKKTQIAIETHKGASKDLDKYYSALDKALMRFHEMKMEEINKYVKEFWQQTYRGDDIETIEIKADLENTANRRSHNYRLVMRHRHLSELDMRGRCSAGQKVLASLVVRLALAETFCHNCGVLALDEPTSNLDERNIGGFTEALGQIVNNRKAAKNNGFQLIIISHDNDFIDNLARLTDVPDYYRVSKDPVTQYSQISNHEVAEF